MHALIVARAYVMGDRRRVFLTEDRNQAFYEFGAAVGTDVLNYDLADHTRPSWEEFSANMDIRSAMTDIAFYRIPDKTGWEILCCLFLPDFTLVMDLG